MVRFYQHKNFNFNDFDLIVKDGVLYAIYVKKIPYPKNNKDSKKPNRYGLAKTRDGFNWEEVGDILLPNPDGWDQSLWAGSISKQSGKYVIYYTAVLKDKREISCKIGKAYSDDLINWKKDSSNPVLEFEVNPYYSDEPEFSFRDPFHFSYQGKEYVIFCAKDKKSPKGKRGCVGIVEEKEPNSFIWLPPLFSPEKYYDGLECPALYNLKGRWYLFFGLDSKNARPHNFRYAISNGGPFGPFKEPKENVLSSRGHYIGRIVKFRGKVLYYSWYRDYPKGMIRERLGPPKEIKIVENGEIRLANI
jgi:predicted GH43/DUF377 family glycosyl hydrolase